MPEPAEHPFVKYVSPVAGHHVERYGTGTVIGGRRLPAPPGTGELAFDKLDPSAMFGRGAGQLVIDESAVVALTAKECSDYGREYGRAIKKGALRERTADEYWAMVDAQERLAKLLQQLKALSPGALARLDQADEVTEESVRAAIVEAQQSATDEPSTSGAPETEGETDG